MKVISLKRNLIIGAIILLLGVFVGLGTASGATIYVDDDNTSGPWDGTLLHPYQFIQEGIDSSSAGDTVYVFNGTYYENLVVDRAISLAGQDKDSTVIDGGGSGSVVSIPADSANISGFLIRNSGSTSPGAGIFIDNSSYTTISGNTISNNSGQGIRIVYGSNGEISQNIVTNNGSTGIFLYYSGPNTISGNNIPYNASWGIELYESDGNDITANTLTDNGFYIKISNNNIISANTITNGGIYLNQTYLNTITDNDLVSDGININLEYTGYLGQWNSHTIENNTLNGDPIRYYKDTSGVVVPNPTAQLILANCTGFTVQGSDISDARRGIQLGYASFNTITGNTITNNYDGIYLYRSPDNQIYENTITNNECGIYLWMYSNGNILYHNNLINNTQNALDVNYNQWDIGYPSGGNYWSDYDGIDADGDGIGDTPYYIPGGYNQDRYPLMFPWGDSTVFVDDDADTSWYDATHVRTIQEAINIVPYGGIVYVYNGIYYENVTAGKKVILVGENPESVIVDGSGSGDVFSIATDSVSIKGFTVQNSGSGTGIAVSSNYNTILSDKIVNNGYGISLQDSSNGNTIYQNNIASNGYGIYVTSSSDSSKIYHNNFINNTQNANDLSSNIWDDGCPSGGNYWDDYTGIDANGNELGDTPYDIPGGNNQDRYPLMNPWNGTPLPHLCGDANGNGRINTEDIVYLINYLFIAGPRPIPFCQGDANVDGTINSADIVYVIHILFLQGPGPQDDCCCGTLK